jgi:hypothetical protein
MVVRFCNITHFLTDRQEKKRKKTINLVKIIKNYKKNGYFSKKLTAIEEKKVFLLPFND